MLFVVLLADADPSDDFAAPLAEDLVERSECRIASVAGAPDAVDPAALAEILRVQGIGCARTIVIAHGAGAMLATRLAAEIDADAIFLLAPLADGPCVAAARSVQAITGLGRADAWLAQLPALDEQAVALPDTILPLALRQSGAMAQIIPALIAGAALPDLSELTARWQRRNAYRLELTEAARPTPSGGIRLCGSILNAGETRLIFGRQSPDRLLIGGRLRMHGETHWSIEARAMPVPAELEPGESARFVISLPAPPATPANDIEIELSLLSEGALWYTDIGFPRLRLTSREPSDDVPKPAPAPAVDPTRTVTAPRSHREYPMPNTTAQTRDEIAAAYLWILGRAPDPDGLTAYLKEIESGAIALQDLRRILLDSPEFRQSRTPLVVAEVGGEAKVVVNPAEPEFGRCLAAGGGWEPHIARAITGQLHPGATFVDVGANVGVMSFQAALQVGAAGKVLAFEPNTDNAALFRRGIVANDLHNVRLFTFALSDREEMICLSDASNAKVLGQATALQALEAVQAIPGDEILLSQGRVDLIKIDVEGFELRVLRGLAGSIRRYRPRILCEFNPMCIREQAEADPELLADHIFGLAPYGDLIEHDGSLTRVSSTSELMRLWEARDAESTRLGLLPQGWVHFDILFDTAAG
ncbi:FkbM family methyltransferase [Sphingomonas kyeonggiensis]|uniref:FkbM family methyltransferase n=1 Tax=Sphingomonas kyeonggiensis TaxID=1268553 RepID=A0A7W6JTJ8_9SPHN|nr:FkbM family methyltransferase [Sphingomonas kyeonggiensis]MBB4099281.1 FkbM family methyltransferase [Sphingomonas kyeonggiensis]